MSTSGQGFELIINETQRILEIRAWGMWDRHLAHDYIQACKTKAAYLDQSMTAWNLLIDLKEYPAKLNGCHHTLEDGLGFLKPRHIQKRAVVVNGSIIRFGAQKAGHAHGESICYSYFRSETDAKHWLLGDTHPVSGEYYTHKGVTFTHVPSGAAPDAA